MGCAALLVGQHVPLCHIEGQRLDIGGANGNNILTDAAGEARNRWRLLEERTRDQSYRLDRDARPAPLTGDPDVDTILGRYRRPTAMGAA